MLGVGLHNLQKKIVLVKGKQKKNRGFKTKKRVGKQNNIRQNMINTKLSMTRSTTVTIRIQMSPLTTLRTITSRSKMTTT